MFYIVQLDDVTCSGWDAEQGGGGHPLHPVHRLAGHRLREGNHQTRRVVTKVGRRKHNCVINATEKKKR